MRFCAVLWASCMFDPFKREEYWGRNLNTKIPLGVNIENSVWKSLFFPTYFRILATTVDCGKKSNIFGISTYPHFRITDLDKRFVVVFYFCLFACYLVVAGLFVLLPLLLLYYILRFNYCNY